MTKKSQMETRLKINNISNIHTATAKSLQSCPTLCDPIDGSPPGSPIPGILQARTLEWVAISFSNAWKWKVKVKSLSRVRPSATPWTAAFQAPPPMGFSRQEFWSELPLPFESQWDHKESDMTERLSLHFMNKLTIPTNYTFVLCFCLKSFMKPSP